MSMKPKPLHKKAHVVTGISAKHKLADWHEPHGALQHVDHYDPRLPGVIQRASLGPSGLQLVRGDLAICIPLDALFDLAGEINPAFHAKPNKSLTPADVEKLSDEKK